MALKSWLTSANDPDCSFPIQNLPYGVFSSGGGNRIGVAIGNRILDVRSCAEHELLNGLSDSIVGACVADVLNPLMALGAAPWAALRRRFTSLLDADQADGQVQARVQQFLIPMREAVMQLPAVIGDYTDFYASIHHATRVGELFRPENPLLPNYKYVPVGYHGRASSIVTSGTAIRRPWGQIKPQHGEPVFGPTQSLDYELEVGFYVGPGNQLGQSVPIAHAEEHIFGLCLLNDWSARDIQSWEYQPLGPFLAKSFATTVSPWIVTLEALAPYRVSAFERAKEDPAPLAYLQSPAAGNAGIDLTLDVYLQSSQMRNAGVPPHLLGRSNLRYLYWTLAQLLAHHTGNGCNLRPGDLLATGTVSGPDTGSEGCLLEMQRNPQPVCLPTGELRRFLHDGDEVMFHAYCKKPGSPEIAFGECRGMVVS